MKINDTVEITFKIYRKYKLKCIFKLIKLKYN